MGYVGPSDFGSLEVQMRYMKHFKSFEGKRIIVTGHTGFKGYWLCKWLTALGASVYGISLSDDEDTRDRYAFVDAYTHLECVEDIRCNIKDSGELCDTFMRIKPDYVFHMAAQAHVRDSFVNPERTWVSNVLGTGNVVAALKKLQRSDLSCIAVFVTSDKCYENREWLYGYRETDKLGGKDAYSASKAAAELLLRSEFLSHFNNDQCSVRFAIARAGNVIGGGDFNVGRIVPDCVWAWGNDKPMLLRNPLATRPWQHVLDPLSGYMSLALNLKHGRAFCGEAFNFGPQSSSVLTTEQLVRSLAACWHNGCVDWQVDEHAKKFPEATLLKLNCDKAHELLGWTPLMDHAEAISLTTNWYVNYFSDPSSVSAFTDLQISRVHSKSSDR